MEGWERMDKPRSQWNNSYVCSMFPKVDPRRTGSQSPSEVTYSLSHVSSAFLSFSSLFLTLSLCVLGSPPR